MKANTLIAAAVAAAFALPLAAQTSDKASGGSPDSSSAGATKADDGGAEAMFKALDKDGDGSLTKMETQGTPHDKDFSKLDKDGDGKLSREEHAAAEEHQKSSTGSSSGKKY